MEKPKIKIKFGLCPHCHSENYNSYESERVNDYEIPYLVYDCYCNDCKKTFTEYFSLDEVKFDDEETEVYATNTLSKGEKDILIAGLNLLVDFQQDEIDYSKIFKKLKGELEISN